jgi:tetratricopeptide (TPR) repeat protein
LEDYPCRFQLTVDEQQKYTSDKSIVQHEITRKLGSAGRNGRGNLLRMSLAILTNLRGPRDVRKVRGDDGIERFFQSLFPDSSNYHVPVVAYMPIHETYSSEAEEFFSWYALRSDWRKVGHLFWTECIVNTKGSEVRYSGPYLFENYQDSAAQEKIRCGDIDGALELYEKLAVGELQAPGKYKLEVAWDMILMISATNRNFDFATRVAESIVAMHPTSAEGWSFLFKVYAKRGPLQEAVERLKLAVAEQHVASFRELGRAYRVMGDAANALETLKQAINLDPLKASFYWTEIGHTYDSIHDRNNAIQAYEMAVALSHEPAPGLLHMSLGVCYKNQGRFRDAIVQFEYELRGLANQGLFREDVFQNITDIYLETGDYDSAIKRTKSAIVMCPEEPSLKSLLGDVFMEAADYDAAILAYEAAIDGGCEEEGHLWQLLGHANECKGDLRGTIEACQMAAEIDPADEACWSWLEELYEAIGDRVRAAAVRRRKEEN